MAIWRATVSRMGIGLVLLWFGVRELVDPWPWIGYIPHWLHLALALQGALIIAHGYLLFVLGGLLLVGLWKPVVSWLGLLMMASIIATLYPEAGLTSILVRDFGLTVLALNCALDERTGYGWEQIEQLLARRGGDQAAVRRP